MVNKKRAIFAPFAPNPQQLRCRNRLNNKHKVIPLGATRRGKRTLAKERLFKTISREIRSIKPYFNIGTSTGTPGGPVDRWNDPYRHWGFIPSEMQYHQELKKP